MNAVTLTYAVTQTRGGSSHIHRRVTPKITSYTVCSSISPIMFNVSPSLRPRSQCAAQRHLK